MIRKWRWDLIGVGAFALAFAGVTTTPSAFFLHFDAPLQGFAAQALVSGCWEYTTEKMLAVYLLTPLFWLFGASPQWEILLLMVLAVFTVVLVYELAFLLSSSRLAGLLAALLAMALPGFEYFSRMQVGYVMPCLLLAWLAVWRGRWTWAGLCFGLTLIAHFGYTVVVGVSIAVLAVFFLRIRFWRRWLAFGAAALAPILLVEATFYAFMGRPFQWLRGMLAAGFLWTGLDNGLNIHANWLWAPATLVHSNGALMAGLLALGLLAPLALRRNRAGLSFSLALIGSIAAFAVFAILRGTYVARAFGALYPIWAICTAVVFAALLSRLHSGPPRQVIAGASLVGLAVALVNSGIFIREFTQSPFPSVERWIQAAGQQRRPVRYNNPWVGLFFAQKHGVEMLTGDGTWVEANEPGQAVLILERSAPPQLTRGGYVVESADVSAAMDGRYPAVTKDADIPRHAEVWWPTGVSRSVKPPGALPQFVIYYSGSGCVSPPAYGNGTLHFYQLVWNKLTQFGRK